MTKLIGIGGRFSSGKDAVADYLVEQHGWVKMGMSDPLADALYTLNPMIGLTLDLSGENDRYVPAHYQTFVDQVGYTEAKKNPEVRRLLQVLGTEVGRNMIGQNTWVDIAERRIKAVRAESKSVILTGVRFHNELKMIQQNSGELWWVNRPRIETHAPTSGHASENSVTADNFGTHITNNGTLEDLYKKVENLLV